MAGAARKAVERARAPVDMIGVGVADLGAAEVEAGAVEVGASEVGAALRLMLAWSYIRLAMAAERVVTRKRMGVERPGQVEGAHNHSPEDVGFLLNCVEQHEPLGSSEWAKARKLHVAEAGNMGRPMRGQDSLKKKLDKLANAKKPARDPACPPRV